MEFFARGGGLAEGHRPIEKYFIVLAFQMANGERRAFGRRAGGGGGGRSANRSLPAELIAYSENNVPYPLFSEGRAASRGHFFFFFFFWRLQKEERFGVLAV